jgi:Protein of unknown function (DUF3152)
VHPVPAGIRPSRDMAGVAVAAVAAVVALGGCAAVTTDHAEAPTSTGNPALQGEVPGVPRPGSTAHAVSTPTAPAVPTPAASPTPTAVEIPPEGTGDFTVAPGGTDPVGTGDPIRYTVEVEGGLPFLPAEIAGIVDATLADPRGWTALGDHAFRRLQTGGDLRVLLATPATTDALCAPLRTRGEVSCRNGQLVVLNAQRWAHGVEAYGDDLDAYRQYVVNHEVGHFLGFGHVGCPGGGVPAPVMLQQTFGLDGCLPNPWPDP